MRDCDSIVFAVDSDDRLEDWVTHLDAVGASHSPILSGGGGQIIVIVVGSTLVEGRAHECPELFEFDRFVAKTEPEHPRLQKFHQ
jgi:hypothetical protein